VDKYYKGVRTEVANLLPKKYYRVLEIGCGEGGFRKNLLNKNEYWGIEPHVEVISIAMSRLDKVLNGLFDEVYNELPDNYFDLIICNDVIEHMIDHHEFYKKIKIKCSEGAYMLGSIPNVRYIVNLIDLLIHKNWEYKNEGILDKTHLRFFTFKSIKNDFKKHNFIVEELYGINPYVMKIRNFYDLKLFLFSQILGKDTKYMQFAFKIKF